MTDAHRPAAAELPPGARRAPEPARESTYAWDLATDALHWAPDAAAYLGTASTAQLATGRLFAARLVPESPMSRERAILSGARDPGTGVAYHARYGLVADPDDRDAAVVWLDDRGRWYAGADGRPARAEGRVRRVMPDVEAGPADPLAALIGRDAFLDHIARKLAALGRPPASFALLVGSFEPARPDALAVAAETVRTQMRARDVLGRISAERLAVFLEACNAEQMGIAAARFADALAVRAIGFRFGGSVAPRDGRDAAVLLSNADGALDAALLPDAPVFVAYRSRLG